MAYQLQIKALKSINYGKSVSTHIMQYIVYPFKPIFMIAPSLTKMKWHIATPYVDNESEKEWWISLH